MRGSDLVKLAWKRGGIDSVNFQDVQYLGVGVSFVGMSGREGGIEDRDCGWSWQVMLPQWGGGNNGGLLRPIHALYNSTILLPHMSELCLK